MLLEEHQQVGVPSHCSGVVSLNGLNLLDLEPQPSFAQRLIYGAKFYPPHGEPFEVRRKEPVALILNRMRFDQFLAKQAIAEGVALRTNARVVKFQQPEHGRAAVALQNGEKIACRVVVDASGAGSRLPEQSGLEAPDWSQLLPGLQYELVDTKRQDNVVELFFGTRRAPGFFAWSIPTSDNSVRAGLASRRGNVKKLLDELAHENWPKATVDATKPGSVLVSGPMTRCWSPGFLAVGDAAGQVKQTTGGGIVIGGYCGMLAGRAASKFAAAKGENSELLREYDVEWRKMFASDLRRMGLARRIFAGLSDETLDRLFNAIRDHVGEIEEFADMDFQGQIISRFLKKRQFASLLPRVAADSIKSMFA